MYGYSRMVDSVFPFIHNLREAGYQGMAGNWGEVVTRYP